MFTMNFVSIASKQIFLTNTQYNNKQEKDIMEK